MADRNSLNRIILFLMSGLLAFSGCMNSPDEQSTGEGVQDQTSQTTELRLLVINDPPLASELERVIGARVDKVTLIQMTEEEFLANTHSQLDAEIVVYPSYLLGEMVQRELLLTIPDYIVKSDETSIRDLRIIDRTEISKYGSRNYGISLGSPSPVLLYRSDLFKQIKIDPPKTWEEYKQTLATIRQAFPDRKSTFAKAAKNESPETIKEQAGADKSTGTWAATCEPLKDEWAAQMLLARTAAYVRRYGAFSTYFDVKTMEPTINSKPFVRALKELVSDGKKNKSDWEQLRPAEVEAAILSGDCAMAIAWPTGTSDSIGSTNENMEIGIAPLPGSRQFFSFGEQEWIDRTEEAASIPLLSTAGRMASVTRGKPGSSFYFQLLMSITNKKMGHKISPVSKQTAPYRKSHFANASPWLGNPSYQNATEDYVDILEKWDTDLLHLQSLRIPGREQYLAALSEAVNLAFAGTDPQTALDDAAKKWQEITQRLGKEEQIKHFQQSLGIER